jgi:hypothetical protein
MSLAQHRNPMLLHRFQKSRLRLGRSTVDLIGEHDIREERSGLEDELPSTVLFLKKRISRDITRKKIGRELNPLIIEHKSLRQPLHQFCFSKSGKSFEENMTSGQNPIDDKFDQLLLPEEDFIKSAAKTLDVGLGFGDLVFVGVFHELE